MLGWAGMAMATDVLENRPRDVTGQRGSSCPVEPDLPGKNALAQCRPYHQYWFHFRQPAQPGDCALRSTKSFLDNFTTALHRELTGTHVHVSVVRAGPVKTEFVEAALALENGGPICPRNDRGNLEPVAERIWSLIRRPRRFCTVPGYFGLCLVGAVVRLDHRPVGPLLVEETENDLLGTAPTDHKALDGFQAALPRLFQPVMIWQDRLGFTNGADEVTCHPDQLFARLQKETAAPFQLRNRSRRPVRKLPPNRCVFSWPVPIRSRPGCLR